MKGITYFDEAIREFADAKDVSPAPAEFDRELFDALDHVRTGRVTPARIGRPNIHQWVFTRLPYSLIYLDEPDAIRVVAFAHHRKRPGYWRKRLMKK